MSGGLSRMESVRKLKELEQESSNVVTFSQRFGKCCGLTGTIGIVLITILFVLVVIGLGFAKLILGSLFLHNCPVQPLVPVWLIVGSLVNFMYNGCFNSRSEKGYCKSILAVFVTFFSFIWLILGSVWIIQANQAIKKCNALIETRMEQVEVSSGGNTTDNTTSSTTSPADICDRCDMRLFNFAFAVLIMEWSVVGLVLALGFFCCCSYCFIKIVGD